MLSSYKEISYSHIKFYGFFFSQKKVSEAFKDMSLLSSVFLHNWVLMIFLGTCYLLNEAETWICVPLFTHNFTHKNTHPKE